jgi:hypothetical protein
LRRHLELVVAKAVKWASTWVQKLLLALSGPRRVAPVWKARHSLSPDSHAPRPRYWLRNLPGNCSLHLTSRC